MIIYIRVKPKSSKQEIEKINENSYLVCLREPAENNRANVELINLLTKYFKISIKDIKIKAGKTSRNKIVQIN